MKPDEFAFLSAMLGIQGTVHTPRDLIGDLVENHGYSPKRIWFLLHKWARKGWYDYGVTLDLGWLTPEGKKATSDALQAFMRQEAAEAAITLLIGEIPCEVTPK